MTAASAAVDETARILAEHGNPEQRLQYAQFELQRKYREAKATAIAAYLAGGGSEPIIFSIGDPLYDALVSAVTSAANEYGRAMDEALAAYRAESDD